MKLFSILFLVLALVLSGCSANSTRHSSLSPPQGPENWRTGYEWTTPQSDTPVMLVADYRHVLTANPPTQYTAPPVPVGPPDLQKAEPPSHLDHKPVVQPVTPKVEPIIVPAPPIPAPKPVLKTAPIKPAETPYDRAWRRYCNNGREMTDEDRAIVGDEKIPEKFLATCRPPK